MRAVLILILIMSSGCGWQLRGLEPIPASLNTLRLEIQNPNDEFGRALRRTLGSAGITILATAEESSTTTLLRVSNVRHERRAISTTDLGKAAEYELVSLLEYEVEDSAGNLIAGPEGLLSEKIYVFDQNNVASASQEEQLLRDEMRRELIQQLLRRYRAVTLPTTAQ